MEPAAFTLQNLIAAIDRNQFRVTDHADEESNADRLRLDDILQSVRRGEIIEAYPHNRPFPSCLILGLTAAGVPVHMRLGVQSSK